MTDTADRTAEDQTAEDRAAIVAAYRELDRLGYAHWIGCEYIPSTPRTEGSLGWARQYGVKPRN